VKSFIRTEPTFVANGESEQFVIYKILSLHPELIAFDFESGARQREFLISVSSRALHVANGSVMRFCFVPTGCGANSPSKNTVRRHGRLNLCAPRR
jgi:hypothetical protein